MRYLITGGAGFIGSHLVELLVHDGAAVTVLDDLSAGSRDNLEPWLALGRVELVEGDAADQALVVGLAARADAIVHLAASVGVRMLRDDPVRTITNNVRTTEAVLAAASARRVPVLLASSSEVYGTGGGAPFCEDQPLLLGPTTRPRFAYASSKLTGEWLALAHARAHGLPVVIARLFNAVGPRQSGRYGMVLPRFVAQATSGAPLTVFGDGTQTRCFTHAQDVARAMQRLLGEPRARGCVFNVGSAEETSIAALALLVKELAGSASEIVHVPLAKALGDDFDDARRRVPDLTRLVQVTGSAPSTPLRAIVAELVLAARGSALDQGARTLDRDAGLLQR